MSRGIPWLTESTQPKLAIHCGDTTSCQELSELRLSLPLQLLLVLGLIVPLFTEGETDMEAQVLPTLVLASCPGWLLHTEF